MPLFTDSPRTFKAVLSAHIDDPDIVREADANPVSMTCVYTLGCPADESRIDATLAKYKRGELSINVTAYERAERVCTELTRQAKQNAVPDNMEQRTAIAWQREQQRNARIASQVSPGIESRRAAQREAQRREWQVRLDAVSRAQRVRPVEGNGDGEGPGE